MARMLNSEPIEAAEAGGSRFTTQPTLFRRWVDSLLAARMRKAEYDLREHLRGASDEMLRRAGYQWRDRSR